MSATLGNREDFHPPNSPLVPHLSATEESLRGGNANTKRLQNKPHSSSSSSSSSPLRRHAATTVGITPIVPTEERVSQGVEKAFMEKKPLKNGKSETGKERNGMPLSSDDPISAESVARLDFRFTPEVCPTLCRLVDEHVVTCLTPTVGAMMRRGAHLRYLAEVLTDAIGRIAWQRGVQYGDIRYYVFGSVKMRTVLPDGDNDLTIDVDGLTHPVRIAGGEGAADPPESPSQAAAVACGELLSDVADHLRQHNGNVFVDALILAEVRVLKLVMDGSSYDVTVGQLGGVDCVRFLHEIDTMVGCQHLIKRTLLLLKAWCSYEAHILGGQGGYISSYAATVMLFAILNTVEFLEDVSKTNRDTDADAIQDPVVELRELRDVTPLKLFARFLKFYSYFDFERYCVTVFGPLPCSSINGTSLDLSRLEVPAARTSMTKNQSSSASNCASNMESREELGEVNVKELGLTEEGKAKVGHTIRRRARPLITASGIKHMLHQERRRRERERQARMGEENTLTSTTEAGTTSTFCNTRSTSRLENETTTEELVRLDRPGCAAEDADLECPTCNTCNFPVRTLNVMDPLRWSSNTCRGVCRNHLQRIRRAFQTCLATLQEASESLGDPRASVSPSPSSNPISNGSNVQNSQCHNQNHNRDKSNRNYDNDNNNNNNSNSDSEAECINECEGSASVCHTVGSIAASMESGIPLQEDDSPTAVQSRGMSSRRENGRGHDLTHHKTVVLRRLFGQALDMAQRHYPERAWDAACQQQLPPGIHKCSQCLQPSIFCVSDPLQVCEAQFIFDRPEDMRPMATFQQTQQPQHQIVRSPVGGGASATASPASSSSGGHTERNNNNNNNNNNNANSTNNNTAGNVGWSPSGSPVAGMHSGSNAPMHNANVSPTTGGAAPPIDASIPANIRHRFARGAPLMRQTGAPHSGKGSANGGRMAPTGVYNDFGAACYPVDHNGYPFFPGCAPAGMGCAVPNKRAVPMGFAPPIAPKSGGATNGRGYAAMGPSPPPHQPIDGVGMNGTNAAAHGAAGMGPHHTLMYAFGN